MDTSHRIKWQYWYQICWLVFSWAPPVGIAYAQYSLGQTELKNNNSNQGKRDLSRICELRDRCFSYLRNAYSDGIYRLVYENQMLKILVDDYVLKEIPEVVFPEDSRCPGCAFYHTWTPNYTSDLTVKDEVTIISPAFTALSILGKNNILLIKRWTGYRHPYLKISSGNGRPLG